jgi:hypothetical protein
LAGAEGAGQKLMSDLPNQLFCFTVLICSFAAIFVVYVAVSERCGSFVNVLTPFLLLQVPMFFVLEGINVYLLGYTGSRYAYVYLYSTYVVGVVAKSAGFFAAPRSKYSPLIRTPALRLPALPYVLLVMACALYAPVLVAHANLLTSPREIYALTRTGYGIQSFISTFCIYIGFVLLLFEPRGVRLSKIVFMVVALLVLYMHGSKGQVLELCLIWLYFLVFVRQRRFNARALMVLGTGTTILMTGLFYITFPDSLRDDLVESIAGYSTEYTRNATLVIDDGTLDPQYGRLALENNFYGFIPRELYPEKRKDFGTFWLASRYFPERFQGERGAPAFGLGVEYADFGVFTIIYYAVVQLFSGAIVRLLVDALKVRPNPGDFVLLLLFLDVALIPTGTGFPLPIYYLIALGVKSVGPKLARSTQLNMFPEGREIS